jgi:hypothetical protein
MAGKTSFLQNKFLDWFFRAQAIGVTGASAGAGSGPTTLWIGLLTAAPSDLLSGGGGTEVTGGNYARASVTSGMSASGWSGTQGAGTTVASSGTAASGGGTISNNGSITFNTPNASWGLCTHFGVYDAVSSGNLLYWAALTAQKNVNNGDPAPYFPAGTLAITED